MKKPQSAVGWIFLVTSVIGLVDSFYLLWIKLANNPLYCLKGVGDCWAVNTSRYSSLFGIPIAVYGIGGYALFLAVFLFRARFSFLKVHLANILFGLALVGVLFSAYLTYLELFVILAVCPFCVLSAACALVLFVLSVIFLVKPQAKI